MPDREKVIKAIDICLGHGKCTDCGYHSSECYTDQNCRGRMLRDVLDLLLEQEPVEPINYEDMLFCGNCRYAIPRTVNFCPKCGRKVKWDA